MACVAVGKGGDKSGALPIISERLALPLEAAAVVPISDWLPGTLLQAWSSPDFVKDCSPAPDCFEGQGEVELSLSAELSQRGFFNTSAYRHKEFLVTQAGMMDGTFKPPLLETLPR